MKTLALLLTSVVGTASLQAQKPPIDSSVYGKWPSVGGGAAISHDGQYVKYAIDNQPVGSRTLVLQATNARWKLEIPGTDAFRAVLTPDSRRAVFLQQHDSLGIVTLGRSAITYIPQVRSFKLAPNGTGEWLAYEMSSPSRELVLSNLRTGRQRTFAAVADYLFSDDGTVLVLRIEADSDSNSGQALQWVHLPESTAQTIWRGGRARNLVFDGTGTQLAFAAEDMRSGRAGIAFWYYRAGTDTAVRLADRTAAGLDTGLRLAEISRFSRDGRRLFVSVQDQEGPAPGSDAVPVHVWSYTDAKLQPQQLQELGPKSYVAVLHVRDGRLIRLQYEHEWFLEGGNGNDAAGLVVVRNGGGGEEHWNPGFQLPWYLVSTADGKRQPLAQPSNPSPGGKYRIYYDGERKSYFTYEVASGVIRNITQGLSVPWNGHHGDDLPNGSRSARGVAGWLTGDAAVLLYDRYDVWQVDPAGSKPPVNLTNGYGRRYQVVFSLLSDGTSTTIAPKAKLTLRAFNWRTKDNGFYRIALGRTGDPERLTMGPYVYDTGSGYVEGDFSPIKARNAETYLVRRMSATESPNYFSTTDFRTFTRLSDLHPERAYNWLTTELHTWTTLDGRAAQGILYKPEDFDSAKQYPVIFHYYERKSDRLNAYLRPAALGDGNCTINIPWYVSRGYLVFTPDIYFTLGETGESVVNAVVSAATYVSQMPWVDPKKMGIQGCSFGGFGTNYLVTHTNLFAAAASAASVSDLISSYGSLGDAGSSWHGFHERGQLRLGATLWERPDLYIKNSPIFRADQVTTPVLLMHATNDRSAASFPQAVEFFTALRRLGKKAWLLQYDEGGHGLGGSPRSIADFSVRMAQFFDHYLKDAPPPKWMTRGIPAKLKGIDRGLELDAEITTPGPGLVADSLDGRLAETR